MYINSRNDLKNIVYKFTQSFCNFNPSENIIIFSDPRGGSTWISEIIQKIPKTAVLWEPLHLAEVDNFGKLNFGWRQYIPENEDWPQAKMAFDEVFRGELLTHWTCQVTSPLELIKSERMIVKFVRGNAMIPWLTKVYNFKFVPLLLLRHPFAVVASQLNYGAWDYNYSEFQIPECPFNEIYVEHEEFLSTLHTKAESLVATWCITNRIPLESERNNLDWITIYYEDLITSPKQELERLFGRWKMEIPDGVIENVNQPSSTTKEATFSISIDQQLSKWMDSFDDEQIIKLQRILDYFSIKVYSKDSLYPLMK